MAMATSRERAPDALGQKEDERHEDEPDGDRPALGECAQPVFQQQEGAGADEGAEERARAAEERHDHHLPRRDPVEGFDGHDSQAEGVERAREAREERGKDEGQVLDPPDVIAARRRAAQEGEERPRREPQPERVQLELGERDARAVGAEAVVGGVAEGQESRIAVEEIEAQREEAEDQHLRGKGLVGNQEREDGEEDSERPHRMAAQPSSDGGRAGHPHSMSPASPKKPLGRTRRTSAITTKTMISASLGAKKVVMPTTCPIMIPATTAPSRLPIPPTTTTTNDSMTMVTPISA